MKRKIVNALLIATMLIVLLTATSLAIIDDSAFTAGLNWESKNGFPGKYVEVGLYKGDTGYPCFDEENVVALYDPVDMDGNGRSVYWQGYWSDEEKRNKEVYEIDNPVFLIAEYENEQLIRLKKITEEELRCLIMPVPQNDDTQEVANDLIVEAIQEYSLKHQLSLMCVADQEKGEICILKAPREEDKSAYLLTQYEGNTFIGFKEVSKEDYDAIIKNSTSENK